MENLGNGLLLAARHRAVRTHIAVLVSTVIVAVHVAIRVRVAVEIGGIAVHVGRVHIAAPLVQDIPYEKYLNHTSHIILFCFTMLVF